MGNHPLVLPRWPRGESRAEESARRPPSEPPRDLADRMIRQALRHPANLRAFLRQVLPALADGFDCERSRLLDREFPLDDWRRREADLPFEVPYRRGDDELWALVYVLLEHQSAEDPAMPLRPPRRMRTRRDGRGGDAVRS